MLLAGDIGGTKTTLALLTRAPDDRLTYLQERTYSSQAFETFDDILMDFLPTNAKIESLCLGIAGPVVEQCCQTTNLPWRLEAKVLQKNLNIADVKLLNDMEAMALGMLHLPKQDLIELNPNAKPQTGNIAVIAAGTGLGQAILYHDGNNYRPIATEGGHCDFAPQTPQQDQLLLYLRKIYPDHVSNERIIAGIGFGHLYDFLRHQTGAPECSAVSKINADMDRNAVISQLGVANEDPLCAQAVNLFVELYGAETGNLALKSLATGGVFIGGGIGPKILPALQNGIFVQAFKAKGRFEPLLDSVSVKLSLNPRTPLIGAINYFNRKH